MQPFLLFSYALRVTPPNRQNVRTFRALTSEVCKFQSLNFTKMKRSFFKMWTAETGSRRPGCSILATPMRSGDEFELRSEPRYSRTKASDSFKKMSHKQGRRHKRDQEKGKGKWGDENQKGRGGREGKEKGTEAKGQGKGEGKGGNVLFLSSPISKPWDALGHKVPYCC